MKKVGIITFHRAINYGAVLQAYALQSTIDALGGKAEIIDYRCTHLENNYSIRKRLASTKSLRSFIAVLLKVGIPMHKKKAVFQDFVKRYLHLSQPYVPDTIQFCDKEYNLLITGSDQVWNYHHTDFDRAYYLGFVKDKAKKVSYAASFGFETLDEAHKDAYRHLLQDFSRISVRESSGVKIVNDLLGDQYDVQAMVDPVFLLEADQWMHKPVPEKNYILVYEMMPSDTLMQTSIAFARKYGKTVVRITGTKHTVQENFIKEVVGATPEQFLSYIHDADMVVTNSFHGTAFSLIFNKEVYVVPLEDGMASLNTRMLSLLDLCGLNDRIQTPFAEVERRTVNWDACNAILREEKQEAKAYLQDMMGVAE